MFKVINSPFPDNQIEDFVNYILTKKLALPKHVKITFKDKQHPYLNGLYTSSNNHIIMYKPRFSFNEGDIHYTCRVLAHELRHAEQWVSNSLPWNDKPQCEADADHYGDIWCWDYFYEKANGATQCLS